MIEFKFISQRDLDKKGNVIFAENLEGNIIQVGNKMLIYNKKKNEWKVLSKEDFERDYETKNLTSTDFEFEDSEFKSLIKAISKTLKNGTDI